MSEKLSVICASLLFAAIPAMLLYAGQSIYHDGYRQAVKDIPPVVLHSKENVL